MLPVRRSPTTKWNWRFRKEDPPGSGTNADFLARARKPPRPKEYAAGNRGDLVLFGGTALDDFRVRVAQSQIRHDLTPSHWSRIGIFDEGDMLWTVPLLPTARPALVPMHNAVEQLPFSAFDDPQQYPNVAVIHFPGLPAAGAGNDVIAGCRGLRDQRSVADLPSLVVAWLGYVWGVGSRGNPLLDSLGTPDAVFVETVYGLADIELTPGLASASSCPEAIYQSAKWWHEFYAMSTGKGTSESRWPAGRYLLRSPEATYFAPGEEPWAAEATPSA